MCHTAIYHNHLQHPCDGGQEIPSEKAFSLSCLVATTRRHLDDELRLSTYTLYGYLWQDQSHQSLSCQSASYGPTGIQTRRACSKSFFDSHLPMSKSLLDYQRVRYPVPIILFALTYQMYYLTTA